jgi:hypothetical protein
MEGQEVLEANKFTQHLFYPHKQDFKTFVFLNLSTLVVELQIVYVLSVLSVGHSDFSLFHTK